ncbi:MAG: hypothetical protein JXB39_15545 [Deltaproteobacteria bacterium]|nr:hypothetical protein [Deltaproteobacteria bacterium]
MKRLRSAALVLLTIAPEALGQTPSGTFEASAAGATWALNLAGSGAADLQGSLRNSAGLQLELRGTVDEGTAAGTGYRGDDIVAYFEAAFEADTLLFVLVPAGPAGMPDFGGLVTLSFARTAGTPDAPRAQAEPVRPPASPPAPAAEVGQPRVAADTAGFLLGTWFHATGNTSIRVTFHPDGTFTEHDESSYSYGAGTADAWGTAGGSRTSGRWRTQGSREAGVVHLVYSGGGTRDVPYRVHVENGQTYWNEYFFAGELYGRER